jgi:hypothetical protein
MLDNECRQDSLSQQMQPKTGEYTQPLSTGKSHFKATRNIVTDSHRTDMKTCVIIYRDFSFLVVHKILVHYVIDSILESSKFGIQCSMVVFIILNNIWASQSYFLFFHLCFLNVYNKLITNCSLKV